MKYLCIIDFFFRNMKQQYWSSIKSTFYEEIESIAFYKMIKDLVFQIHDAIGVKNFPINSSASSYVIFILISSKYLEFRWSVAQYNPRKMFLICTMKVSNNKVMVSRFNTRTVLYVICNNNPWNWDRKIQSTLS